MSRDYSQMKASRRRSRRGSMACEVRNRHIIGAMNTQINYSQEQLVSICRKYHIARLSLFGSALRDDFRPDSDLDLIVEFEPGHGAGYITLGAIADEFAAAFANREIDLLTP